MPANIYKLKDGTIVPGVTTIINQLDKPALVQWAWKLGKEGKDWKTERDSASDIGTKVHGLIMMWLQNADIDDANMTDIESKCLQKFVDYFFNELGYPLVECSETAYVSERHKFGGQPDLLYLSNDSKYVLCDIKTSNGIYDSYWLQLAGYDILLRENGYKVDEYQILWLPKDGRFGCPLRKNLTKEKKIFKHLLEIHKLRRE